MQSKDGSRVFISTCGCGKPLYASFDKDGTRRGVTHLDDDEDHHNDFFSPENYTVETHISHLAKNN